MAFSVEGVHKHAAADNLPAAGDFSPPGTARSGNRVVVLMDWNGEIIRTWRQKPGMRIPSRRFSRVTSGAGEPVAQAASPPPASQPHGTLAQVMRGIEMLNVGEELEHALDRRVNLTRNGNRRHRALTFFIFFRAHETYFR